MIVDRHPDARFTWRERLIGGAVVLSLALPLIPVPGDGITRMHVVARDPANPTPITIKAETPRSTCEALAFALAYEDHGTGAFRRVVCNPTD